MPTSTVENYIKQIFTEERNADGTLLATGRLAAIMRVTPGTATAMVKTLAQQGLIHYEPRGGVRLTDEGRSLALRVLRRHRLVELFLVKCLHLDWSEVHEEAEAWEHVISDRVLDRMDELLGHPSADPHGAPIPSASGTMPVPELTRLSRCEAGAEVLIRRVSDQDSAFLIFMDQHGLRIGARVRVESIARPADAISLHIADSTQTLTLGLGAAERIHVEVLPTAAR